jgi:hypothetical protein
MKKLKPPKELPHSTYHAIWRIIDGAVREVIKSHPEYFNEKRHFEIRRSIVKRATGSITLCSGYSLQRDSGLAESARVGSPHEHQGQDHPESFPKGKRRTG